MPIPRPRERPTHLPKGLWGWISENVLWLTVLAAAAAGAALVVWAEAIFR